MGYRTQILDYFSVDGLPVDQVVDELVSELQSSQLVALKAPPGSGKTILAPAALLEEMKLSRIYVLEPRRITARLPALALRELLGPVVGYKIRLESLWDRQLTKLGYLTYGTALRSFLHAPPRADDLVVFDEFHERSWEAEVLLAYLRSLPDPPKILLMSATLDTESLPTGLPLVESDGRLHPITISWETHEPQILGDKRKLAALVAARSLSMARQNSGEQLIFLPGLAEIKACLNVLEADSLGGEVDILHSSLPEKEIRRVVDRSSLLGFRRILSTNLAESSVTLPGIEVVIDAGMERKPYRDELDLGVTLKTIGASVSALEQRAGRAGRLRPGLCHRLFTKNEEIHRPRYPKPELEQADFKSIVLLLAQAQVLWNWTELPWLYPPDPKRMEAALHWANVLELVSGPKLQLTPRGRTVLSFPLDPRSAVFATLGAEAGLKKEILTGVCLTLDGQNSTSAAQTLEEALKEPTAHHKKRSPLAQRIAKNISDITPTTSTLSLNEILLKSHFDTVCQLTSDRALCAEREQEALLFQPSEKLRSEFAVVLSTAPRGGRGPKSQVRLYHLVELEELWESHFDELEETSELLFYSQQKQVKFKRVSALGQLILEESIKNAQPSPEAAEVLYTHLTESDFGEDFAKFALRLELLFQHLPKNREILATVLNLSESDEDWKKAMILSFLQTIGQWDKKCAAKMFEHSRGLIPFAVNQTLKRELPEEITLPRRRRAVKVHYRSDAPPYIESKLQDFFGWTPPTLLAGALTLNCHLLAPNGRACQITDNLQAFWSGSYKQVRKDLRGRYPKHDWPENPDAPGG